MLEIYEVIDEKTNTPIYQLIDNQPVKILEFIEYDQGRKIRITYEYEEKVEFKYYKNSLESINPDDLELVANFFGKTKYKPKTIFKLFGIFPIRDDIVRLKKKRIVLYYKGDWKRTIKKVDKNYE